jgi:integrase
LLDQCAKNRTRCGTASYNKYRAYLMMLFSELLEIEAIDFNPVKDIKKKTETVKIREELTINQRSIVNKFLQEKHYSFWRMMQIFFHSGSRITEIMRVQVKDIDIDQQRCKYLVKKGTQRKEVHRAIKDSIIHLWIDLVKNAHPDDYIFSRGLVPGAIKIRPDQISKRWYRLIKKNKNLVKITADFYSLKHSNSDETAALLDINDAAAHNSHSSPVITMKHYAQGEKDRQMERIKKVGNTFSN